MFGGIVTADFSSKGPRDRSSRVRDCFMVACPTAARSVAKTAFTLAISLSLSLAILEGRAAHAADGHIIKRGDAVVTGFSGTKTEKDVPPDVHPLDRTFIDPNGSAAQIFDLSVLGTAPRGQLSDVPSILKIKAGETGQVFGVTLDSASTSQAPNAYLTSSSMFGLQIVSEDKKGNLTRLLAGAPDAKWMPGQFGLEKGGTPASIWKVDGRTGAVSLFANVKNDGRDNAGAGLGNITFDPKTRRLYVSNLETGLVHSFSLDGQERDLFDHGEAGRKAQGLDPVTYDDSTRMDSTRPNFNSEDTATWGFADERRRVFGLAVSNGRLYYGVAEGPAVWSVSVDDDGDFGNDARIELEIQKSPPGTNITDILFDGTGVMYLSQRGSAVGSYDYSTFATPQQAVVQRYTWDEKAGRWTDKPAEYAIGLAPEFRGTQGGIALNYGYDKFGNIDYGKCRQTLWTTGEHLREGDDVVRVSTGGAKIVHGLQGNYKSQVRPANEPPYQSWFTDYDSRAEDAEAYGHIGDVAIYEPCDGARGEEHFEQAETVAPMAPPADEPGLILDKRCYAGAIGGKIRCTIQVRNVSNHLPVEDIKIIDVTRIMAGPGTGTLVPIVSFSLPTPGILCATVPSPDFWCTIPAALLPPGEVIAIDVWVNTHDLALAGNLGFRNCAVLKHPDGYAKACAEGGTDIVVEKIGPPACVPGGSCKFGLRIANAGLLPYDGDVLVADAMFVGGGVPVAPVTAINPPVSCISGDTSQLPFTCLTHLSLAPGEEHVHWVDVTMPAPGGYWAENCFGVLDPALVPGGPVPPALLGGPGGSANPACVWVEVPIPAANLKIEKKTAGTGQCDKIGGDLFCKYDITLTNQNTVDFNNVLKFDETVPTGANLTLISPPWGCGGASPNYTCDTGGPVLIPAGGSISTQVTLQISVPDVEAIGCQIPNEVKITTPAAGTPLNADGSDDTASATAWTLGLTWIDGGGMTHTICDPTNLKVKKVATGPCSEDGGGWLCGYEVTVTNAGPDPYKGPVKLNETFASAPVSVNFGGPFTCSGAGASYKCQTGVVSLAKGQSITLTVDAKVADNGTCRMPNTASLTFPIAGSKGNGNAADDIASATASIPSERCSRSRPSSLIPPPTLISQPRCGDGRPRGVDGTCPCPLGTRWNRESRSCENPQPRCWDQARRRDDGSCCPSGTVYDEETDRCRVPVSRCRDPERRTADGTCCPQGTVANESGTRCVTIETACPPDTRWDYIAHECVQVRPSCDEGERYNWRTRQCERPHRWCPAGTHLDRDGDECVRDEGRCPEGQRYDRETHQCVRRGNDCGAGKHYDRRKEACVPDQTTDACQDGSPHLANGACRCPQNRIWNSDSGHCERKDNGPANSACPKGQHRVGNTCLPDRVVTPVPGGGKPPGRGPGQDLPKCSTGQHLLGKTCVPDRVITPPAGGGKPPVKDTPPQLPDCPKGQHAVGQRCVADKVPSDTAQPVTCPEGKHLLGKSCVPDKPVKLDLPPPVKKHHDDEDKPKRHNDEDKPKRHNDDVKPKPHAGAPVKHVDPPAKHIDPPAKHKDPVVHQKIEQQRQKLQSAKKHTDDDAKKKGPIKQIPGLLKKSN